jgi:hypothetical protein
MKDKVFAFLTALDTVNAIPAQLSNDAPALVHIPTGQTFSLCQSQTELEDDELPSFLVTSKEGARILLNPNKVIRFLLRDYSVAESVSDGGNAHTIYAHLKEHLFHKTGYLLN